MAHQVYELWWVRHVAWGRACGPWWPDAYAKVGHTPRQAPPLRTQPASGLAALCVERVQPARNVLTAFCPALARRLHPLKFR
jgi:hypothetical protein